jgi:hypothetical protein
MRFSLSSDIVKRFLSIGKVGVGKYAFKNNVRELALLINNDWGPSDIWVREL